MQIPVSPRHPKGGLRVVPDDNLSWGISIFKLSTVHTDTRGYAESCDDNDRALQQDPEER